MKLKVLFTLCILFALPVLAIAGKPPVTKWTVKDPFEQKAFIENKGQFAIPDKNIAAGDVLYGARVGGLKYYFTKNSIWISHQLAVKRTDAEIAKLKSKAGKNLDARQEKEIDYSYVEEFHQMNFIDANSSAAITPVNEVSYYYNYGMGGNTSVKANAYKKIIYTGIYPGIDMEVYFPENKNGFEYDFIVHPGADIAQIKIQYPLNEGMSLDEKGNMVIKSVYGDFTENTPVANQTGTTNAVACSFTLNNGVVQFKAGNYNRGNTLTIDPFVKTPPIQLGALASAFDVDWDNGSNCYVYGGDYPWTLAKYGPDGNFLWSYVTSFTVTTGSQFFGDFGVDRFSKSVYITEGLNTTGAQIVKLNSAGGVLVKFAGNPGMTEGWRIAFSRCTPHQAVVGGGDGTTAPFNSAFVLDPTDSNLNSITPVNVLSTTTSYHDVCLLTLDDAGNAYIAYSASSHSNLDNNTMVKAPVSNLAALAWTAPWDNYYFALDVSVYFAFGNDATNSLPNGFEGMTYSTLKDLYTYDSYTLERWNTTNGLEVGGGTVVNIPVGGNNNIMHWSGLGSNNCNDIFLGTGKNIQEYDSSLAKVGAPISMGDTVYSVKMGNYNLLYACGQNFVTVIQLDIPRCLTFTAPATPTNATCVTPGSISIKPTGGTSPYNYELLDSAGTAILSKIAGQTTGTFSGLAAGTYIVSATDSSCLAERIYDTVKILKIATYSPGLVTPNPATICSGSSVVLNATLANTYSWRDTTLTYPTGLSDSSGNSVTANPTVTTTYFCIARTPGDCPDTIRAVVNVNPLPQIAITPDTPSICTSGTIVLTASGASTYTWAPTIGLSSGAGSSVTANPVITSTYTVTGTDVNNCVNDTTVVVSVYPYPVVTASPADTICAGKSATLLANGATTYTWTPSTGLSASTGASVTATPAASTTYSVSGTTHGCTTTPPTLDSVTVNPLPTVAIAGLNPLYCVDAPAIILNGGTPTGGYYSGTGVVYGADTTFNPTTAGSGGPYTVTYTYTNAVGCTNTGTAMVTVAPLPVLSILPANPVVCSGNPVTLTAIGASTYVWTPGGSTDSTTVASITIPTRYSVTGTDSNGCVDTVSAVVNIGTLPDTGFVMNVPSQCNSLSVQFISTDTTSSTAYLWKFGDGTTSSAIDPEHNFPKAGTDTVKLYETNIVGCEDSTIHIEKVTSPEEAAIFPNAFQPGDAKEALNNYFKPFIVCTQVTGYVFRVYNRWGQLVFSSNDQNLGWDGTFNGVAEQVDVYVYYMQFTCGNCPTTRQGNVTLLR